MRLRHIEIFHAIYTTGSITNAAKILHVSQPSVSKVLSHAEMQLGFNLFERVKGRLIPTNEAQMLFGEVDKIYQQMRSIKNTAENIKKTDFGNISIGVTPALGFGVLPRAIAGFQTHHPKVNFDIQTVHNNEVTQALFEHKCDFAMLFSPNEIAGLNCQTIAESELVIMYPKAMFPDGPEQLSLAQLEESPFIDISDSGPLGDLLWSRMMEENVQLQSTIKVQTYFIAARMVAEGAGVCVVDKFTAQGNLSDNIAFASFSPKLTFNIGVMHLENHSLSRVSEDFLSYISKEIN
ncbi:LysR family transcriptional regulator [Thalassotalea loyana]|uniref:LysR family transcriptional regulator n=1 Tax=Thalassotalea loyana TaxID=280483 RepID=A0ABQ6HFW7_9GAMM|nr:LysR family transcriptional regulator [Thalassotalea loyana]GLX86482.1 LysR family transcriptional regulator [Thalassotalea loyana]